MVVCVFFFFKQKTAYEMRISDWSSDVCSSDLLPVAFAFAVRHVFAAFDNRQIGVEKMVADAALQGEAPRETADMPVVEEQATDATWFISMLEEEIVVAPFLQRRICRCAVAVGETVAGRARGRMPMLRIVFKSVVRRRSEEHTSELQSLMRISYA